MELSQQKRLEMERYAETVADLSESTRTLEETVPDVWSAFAEMHKAAVATARCPPPPRS